MKLHVVYGISAMHSAEDGTGLWQEIVREQTNLFRDTGLTECSFQITYLGPRPGMEWVRREAEAKGVNAEIVQTSENLMHYETFSMHAIERWASVHDGAVLYLHTKGVSSPEHRGKIRWRHLMQEYLVRPWRDHLKTLEGVDAIGVNWRDMPPISHFCGNFWMARGDYLRSLTWFGDYHARRNFQRTNCEFWISSSNREPNIVSLVHRNADYCADEYFGRPD